MENQTDPEDREIKLGPIEEEEPLYGYQFTWPVGVAHITTGRSMAEVIADLNAMGIEPFMILRVGPVLKRDE